MRVLVANRGEIAVRVIRTLKAMGVPALAVYERADAAAAHVTLADAALPAAYMDGPALVEAARAMGATAVHPGYGFLSQSAAFAQACQDAGLVFIGPSPEAMRRLGDKRAARALAEANGVPVVPGAGAVDDLAAARACAEKLGYPVLVKAAGGGGGRGMRQVAAAGELAAAYEAAGREAAAFGDPRLMMERFVHPARHIEVQVLGDGRRAVALGERECSLQRRFQKVVEESPAPHLAPAVRARLEAAAVRLAEAAGYQGAATVEFLVGPGEDAYFLEVNTRLQVEHPVTEACRGIDLVAWQVEVAHGAALPAAPGARGHAIEVRLNAERPEAGFLPSSGPIAKLSLPHAPGLRIDHALQEGDVVSPLYDALLAKLVVHAPGREAARRRLVAALRELVLLGPGTNQAFLLQVLEASWFAAGETFTHTLEALEHGAPTPPPWAEAARAAWRARPAVSPGSPAPGAPSPWTQLGRFRMSPCG